MKKKLLFVFLTLLLVSFILGNSGCSNQTQPKTESGIKKATAKVIAQSDGLTIEQQNIKNRIEMENKPGSIKHLYVISAMSGQVIFYSTVKGKVTSSGKRLNPYKTYDYNGNPDEEIPGEGSGGSARYTNELIQDDGTYGSSISYLYWWDVQGRYHQHYVSGGQIMHISDQPIPVKSIIINLEAKR